MVQSPGPTRHLGKSLTDLKFSGCWIIDKGMATILTFHEWTSIHEAARRSFSRTLAKFDPTPANKPVAILTAWRGELRDASGKPHPETMRRRLNDEANRKLVANVRRRGLSIVPVVGAGQEEGEDGTLAVNREESYIVQPVGEMGEKEFLGHIKDLLHNPTGEPGRGPYSHTQWGGVVKLPSQPRHQKEAMSSVACLAYEGS